MTFADKVHNFHVKIGAPTNSIQLEDEYMDTRIAFIDEELGELEEAMAQDDRVGVLDGIVDSVYVLLGTGVAVFGAEAVNEAFERVHQSNMTKDAAGKAKAVKGTAYRAPRLGDLV